MSSKTSSTAAKPEQTPEQLAAILERFLTEHQEAVVLEHGKVIFDLRESKFALSTEHGRCTVQFWGEGGNIVRRVVAADIRGKVLRVSTMRFGQARPQLLEVAADRDRRPASTREAMRLRYVKVLERVLSRQFPEWKTDGFRTAMDLERSFGPAYARGLLVRGTQSWAVIGINDEEMPATIDGILTLGILWLEACREASKRIVLGLKVIVPRGTGTLTLARMAWLNGDAAQWEMWELSEREEELVLRDAADQGNIASKLIHAPNVTAARERFSDSAARVMAMVPAGREREVEMRVRSGSEMAFLLHGLEFARVRIGGASDSFNRQHELTFGAGANETPLTTENEPALREMVARLFARRLFTGDKRDPLYRMQPERWLEGAIRRDIVAVDDKLDVNHVYAQVPAFAASDRGMMDLLSVHEDGRLAVLELKADDDLQLALQGLDYWIRVRWHHAQNPDLQTGLGEFQRHGYFAGVRLSPEPPRLYLVAPALRIHPATEVVLRYLSRRVEWTLVALDERWREHIKVVWRKRSSAPR